MMPVRIAEEKRRMPFRQTGSRYTPAGNVIRNIARKTGRHAPSAVPMITAIITRFMRNKEVLWKEKAFFWHGY